MDRVWFHLAAILAWVFSVACVCEWSYGVGVRLRAARRPRPARRPGGDAVRDALASELVAMVSGSFAFDFLDRLARQLEEDRLIEEIAALDRLLPWPGRPFARDAADVLRRMQAGLTACERAARRDLTP